MQGEMSYRKKISSCFRPFENSPMTDDDTMQKPEPMSLAMSRRALHEIRELKENVKPWTMLGCGMVAGAFALQYAKHQTIINSSKWEGRKDADKKRNREDRVYPSSATASQRNSPPKKPNKTPIAKKPHSSKQKQKKPKT